MTPGRLVMEMTEATVRDLGYLHVMEVYNWGA